MGRGQNMGLSKIKNLKIVLLAMMLPYFLAGAVQAAPSITLSKSVSDNSPVIGNTYRYYVTANNTDSVTGATGTVITDVVPAGIQVVGISAPGTQVGNTLTWNLGTLSCSSKTVTLPPNVDFAGSWGNKAQVMGLDGLFGVATFSGSNNADTSWFGVGPFQDDVSS